MKIKLKFILLGIVILSGGAFLVWKTQQPQVNDDVQKIKITVYKSPTCDCCSGYVTYLRGQGFNVKVEDVRDALAIKEKYGVPPELEACHTAVMGDYFIEGHVPVKAIEKLLSEKPKIKGIALPGMPAGAPGMTGPKLGKLDIYGLSEDGKTFEFFSL